MNFRSRWVLVTGASSGLGQAMAKLLAREHGANLILVARREDRLIELKKSLEADCGVQVRCIPADLSKLADVDRVIQEIVQGDEPLYAAVLNAGVTHFGPWDELSFEGFQQMLAVNVTSVVRLTTQLIPHLKAQNLGGGVMLVSSAAGLTPVAYQTMYSATKAFLINFGCGLFHELNGSNVSITTFAPGGIITEMTAGKRFDQLRGWLMPVDRCAKDGLAAFASRRYLHVPGAAFRLGTWFTRLLPQRIVTEQVAQRYRRSMELSQAAE